MPDVPALPCYARRGAGENVAVDAYLDGKLAASVDELLGGADIDEIELCKVSELSVPVFTGVVKVPKEPEEGQASLCDCRCCDASRFAHEECCQQLRVAVLEFLAGQA